MAAMEFDFEGEVWYWRGPAPFYFVSIPAKESNDLKQIMKRVTYGWGMIPVAARIGSTEFTTALFHKDGLYVMPLKDKVRKAEGIAEGSQIRAWLAVKSAQ